MSQKPSSPSPSPTPSHQPLRRSLVSYQFMHGHYNITTPRHELIRSLVPSPPPPLSLSPLVPRSSPPLFRRCFRRPALLHPPPRFQSPMRRHRRRPPSVGICHAPPFSLVFVSNLFGICLAPPFSFAFCHVFPLLSLVFVPFPLGFCHALTWILSHFPLLPLCFSTTYPSPYSIYSFISKNKNDFSFSLFFKKQSLSHSLHSPPPPSTPLPPFCPSFPYSPPPPSPCFSGVSAAPPFLLSSPFPSLVFVTPPLLLSVFPCGVIVAALPLPSFGICHTPIPLIFTHLPLPYPHLFLFGICHAPPPSPLPFPTPNNLQAKYLHL